MNGLFVQCAIAAAAAASTVAAGAVILEKRLADERRKIHQEILTEMGKGLNRRGQSVEDSEAPSLEELHRIQASCRSYALSSNLESTTVAEAVARVSTQKLNIDKTAEDVRNTASKFLTEIKKMLEEHEIELNIRESIAAEKQQEQDTKIKQIEDRLNQCFACRKAGKK